MELYVVSHERRDDVQYDRPKVFSTYEKALKYFMRCVEEYEGLTVNKISEQNWSANDSIDYFELFSTKIDDE